MTDDALLAEAADKGERLTTELEAAYDEIRDLRPLKAEVLRLEEQLADAKKANQRLQAEADQRERRDDALLGEAADKGEALQAELEAEIERHDQDNALIEQLLAERPQLSRQRADAEKRAETLQAELDRRDRVDKIPESPQFQAGLQRLMNMVAEEVKLPVPPRPASASIGPMTLEDQVAEVEAWMPTEAARMDSMPLLGGAKR